MTARTPYHTTAEGGCSVPHQRLVELMKEDAARTEVLYQAVVTLLEDRIEANDRLVLPPGKSFAANITIAQYLGRFRKYSNPSPCTYAVGLIYLERLKRLRARNTPLLTTDSYQRLVLVATMLAAKFFDDFYHSNKHWALIGGIPLHEINEVRNSSLVFDSGCGICLPWCSSARAMV